MLLLNSLTLTPYVPVAVLARELGARGDVVDDVRAVAAAYHPHTEPTADSALQRLLAALPEGDEELVAARVMLLVQACEATAGRKSSAARSESSLCVGWSASSPIGGLAWTIAWCGRSSMKRS